MALPAGVEGAIARRLVASALAAGCSISVWDGEAWALRSSVFRPDILDALASTDEDVLFFRLNGVRIGSVTLIWGNGEDLVSDCSWPRGTEFDGSVLERIVDSASVSA